MNRERLATCIVLATLLLLPDGGGNALRAEEQDPAVAETSRLVDEIMKEVEVSRGLTFKAPIVRKVFSPEEIKAMALEKMKKDAQARRLRECTAIGVRLGFFPSGTDLLEAMVDLLEEGAMGFYDPDDKSLSVLRGFSPNGARPIIFHELIHALEDQYFGLGELQEKYIDSSDRSAALTAVVEGSAMCFMQSFIRSRPEVAIAMMRDMAKQSGSQQEAMVRLPVVVTVQVALFPYTEGLRFVREVTGGRAEEVSRLYSDLPVSTEQVLHAEKYGPGGDFPYRIELPDFGEVLPAGWEGKYTDDLGELGIAVLLNELEGGDGRQKLGRIIRPMFSGIRFRGEAKSASEGWDGDRMTGFFGPDGEAALVWASRWDSPLDAREFATAYSRRLPYKWETLGVTPRTAQVEVRGDRVLIVEGFPQDLTWDVVRAAWEGATFLPDPRDSVDMEGFQGAVLREVERIRGRMKMLLEQLR